MAGAGNRYREVERKFLVNALPDNLESYPHSRIEQGYLAIAPAGVQVRLRKASGARSLTYKRALGGSREEREIKLTQEQFDILWPATEGKRLTKTRYDIPLGKRVVEIDVYSGAHEGLIVAEVEFRDEESARSFQPPDWLGDDVTHDARYSNQLLAGDFQQPSI
ncbi:MAG: CYTH domain-containing protein [Chthoniobacterales bacterium]|nr:CYTH domain-containing protein [Chthoniobacterales bacterium]